MDLNYHPPKIENHERYTAIRDKGKELAEIIELNCKDGREKYMAFIKLQEAVFWAHDSIDREEQNGIRAGRE